MSEELRNAVLVIGVGLFFAVHCSRAGLREWRSGTAQGILGSYHRGTDPLRFWVTVLATGLAGLLGLLFVVFGINMLQGIQ